MSRHDEDSTTGKIFGGARTRNALSPYPISDGIVANEQVSRT